MRTALTTALLSALAVLSAGRAEGQNKRPPLALGQPMEWTGERDKEYEYTLDIEKPGIYRIDAQRICGKNDWVTAEIHVDRDGEDRQRLYTYVADKVDTAFLFYPVLAEGRHIVTVSVYEKTPKTKISMTVTGPVALALTDAQRKEAAEAVEKGIAWLQKSVPPAGFGGVHPIAQQSLAMMALAEGKGGRSRVDLFDRKYVPWLNGFMEAAAGGSWQGKPTRSLRSVNTYEQAIAVLGLSAAAEAGSKPAAALAEQLLAYLMAAQATTQRPRAWNGPIGKTQPYYGGWRYAALEESGDLSITGWCTVALVAADAAGLRVAGMADSVEQATAFARRCGCDDGFAYEAGGYDTNCIRNSIGLLLFLLCGLEGDCMDAAMAHIDLHLPAGTQLDDGEHPFYYWYYATRANYLRGKQPWETWRAAMVTQLLRRQQADGHWSGIRGESQMDGYSTALAVMILRLCLDEAPRYLKMEVRGF